MRITKKWGTIFLLIALVCCLSACGAGNSEGRTGSVMQREDPHITSVKTGSPVSCPDKTSIARIIFQYSVDFLLFIT